MGATTFLLAITIILAVTPEIFGAKKPALCEYPPAYSFTVPRERKWGYYPGENVCRMYQWNSQYGSANVFNTKRECMETCQDAPLLPANRGSVKCLCTCPRCKAEDPATTEQTVTSKAVGYSGWSWYKRSR